MNAQSSILAVKLKFKLDALEFLRGPCRVGFDLDKRRNEFTKVRSVARIRRFDSFLPVHHHSNFCFRLKSGTVIHHRIFWHNFYIRDRIILNCIMSHVPGFRYVLLQNCHLLILSQAINLKEVPFD